MLKPQTQYDDVRQILRLGKLVS